MDKTTLKKQASLILLFTGITWLFMSIMIFIYLKTPFTWDKFFYYFLMSVLIGIYALYLLNRGKLFSKLFFLLAYFVSFIGFYIGATNTTKNLGEFTALILMIIPMISISALGFMIDLNIMNKKKAKELKKH